jgi:hypothetical protein
LLLVLLVRCQTDRRQLLVPERMGPARMLPLVAARQTGRRQLLVPRQMDPALMPSVLQPKQSENMVTVRKWTPWYANRSAVKESIRVKESRCSDRNPKESVTIKFRVTREGKHHTTAGDGAPNGSPPEEVDANGSGGDAAGATEAAAAGLAGAAQPEDHQSQEW